MFELNNSSNDRDLIRSVALRGELVAWIFALGALAAFVPLAPHTLVPEPLAWCSGLASHWQWVFLALGLAGTTLALPGRRLRALLPTVVIMMAWLYQSPSAAQAPGNTAGAVTVASANLNFEVTDHTALKAWLTSGAGADVVAFQEFTDSAKAAVTSPEVLAVYPHQVLEPSADQFGLAVLSKHPIESVERVDPANPLATLKLRAVVAVNGHRLAFTAVHPMPPVSSAYAGERDASLHAESARLVSAGIPGILAGDMNDTPWSTGIRGAAPMLRATGIRPTWPNAWGWFSTLPLDHVLVTPGVRVVSSSLGPNFGSDHRPVVAKLSLTWPD